MKNIFLVLFLSLALTGCINSATARLTPGTNLGIVKSFCVLQEVNGNEEIQKLITSNLKKRGYSAISGYSLPQQHNIDLLVTYTDKWTWDITPYLLELTINFRDPKNSFPVAIGNSVHTSLSRLSPEEMVDEVLTNIFNSKPIGN